MGGYSRPSHWPPLEGAKQYTAKNASYPELCWLILSQFITDQKIMNFIVPVSWKHLANLGEILRQS